MISLRASAGGLVWPKAVPRSTPSPASPPRAASPPTSPIASAHSVGPSPSKYPVATSFFYADPSAVGRDCRNSQHLTSATLAGCFCGKAEGFG